jgi:hypothetical protein
MTIPPLFASGLFHRRLIFSIDSRTRARGSMKAAKTAEACARALRLGAVILMKKLIHLVAVVAGVLLFASAGSTHAAVAALVAPLFLYPFSSSGTLHEAGAMERTTSPYFWVNSGGGLRIGGGVGSTLAGDQRETKWGKLYAKANPLDTDNGSHPQNLFRLVTRSAWRDFTQQVYARIADYHVSASPNREGHNGILLFNRYQTDGQTLYYAGVRVDGRAVIKKKVNGTYTTLASKKVFSGIYDRTKNPNLLPENAWLGIKTVVQDVKGGVSIKLYLDTKNTGVWTETLSVIDDSDIGGKPITQSGYGGIRTDFMDVEFDNYRISSL